VLPEQKPTPVLPGQEPAAVLPEQKPTPVLPEQKPTPVLPEQKPTPVLPEQKPTAPGIDAADALEDAADFVLEELLRLGALARSGDEAGFEDTGSEFAKVQQLIDANQYDEAIEALRKLKREDPSKALYPYVMAEVFFKKRWLKDSLDFYREAMRLNPALRSKSTLNENLIFMLDFDQINARVRMTIIRQVGRTALPYLRRAAKSDPSAKVRKRAASIAATIAKSNSKPKFKSKTKSRQKHKSRKR
jgi:tetratricopeptide (TPR) repeat protein